ncbi:MAG: hypothetical protein E6357_29575 [Clostridiales bacterium]|nr:hypothetical protein [Clostridiales bacterium]
MKYDNYMKMTLPYVCAEKNAKLNTYIYRGLEDLLTIKNITLFSIESFINDNSYLIDLVKSTDDLIMSQPVAYLLFYLVEHLPYQTIEAFPCTVDELEPFFIYMGKNLDY